MSTHKHSRNAHSCLSEDEKKIALVAGLTGLFIFVEMIGGIISGSLALISHAGHTLKDFRSLFLAWIALRLSRRPADNRRSYGFDRFSVLAAFVKWDSKQDHQFIKGPVRQMCGFKSIVSASTVLNSFEAVNMIRKRQFDLVCASGFRQFAEVAG
ncbi:cation transporter [Ruegeria sp. SCP11]|uniref:cation transporter n=1 Tax=Ruegeria sp. SCP11 TaxID=3141378 RepID=UPI00333D5BA3